LSTHYVSGSIEGIRKRKVIDHGPQGTYNQIFKKIYPRQWWGYAARIMETDSLEAKLSGEVEDWAPVKG